MVHGVEAGQEVALECRLPVVWQLDHLEAGQAACPSDERDAVQRDNRSELARSDPRSQRNQVPAHSVDEPPRAVVRLAPHGEHAPVVKVQLEQRIPLSHQRAVGERAVGAAMALEPDPENAAGARRLQRVPPQHQPLPQGPDAYHARRVPAAGSPQPQHRPRKLPPPGPTSGWTVMGVQHGLRDGMVSHLTMGNPELRHHAPQTHGELQSDALGYLEDVAMRRALVQMGGGGSLEVHEALGALRLAAKQVHHLMERFAESHGLSESRLQVLTRLYHSPDHRLALGALAEGLNVTPRTMTDIVDVLERDGLAQRLPDPADRRSVLAVITPDGLSRIEEVRAAALAKQAAIAEGFTLEQLVQLRHLCLLLVQNLSRDQGGH
jgi:DNA-binding MarR family transcriptional regulator